MIIVIIIDNLDVKMITSDYIIEDVELANSAWESKFLKDTCCFVDQGQKSSKLILRDFIFAVFIYIWVSYWI